MEIYSFIFYSWAGAILTGLACSLIGVVVITMGISFIGVCMSHAAFAGALAGIIMHINPVLSSFIFCFIVAGILGPISDKGEIKADTSLGIVFSSSLGLSFLLLPLIPGSKSEGLRFLWGNILTVSDVDIIIVGVVCILVLISVIAFFKEIQLLIFNRIIAASTGIPAKEIYYLILFLCGAAITASIKAVGGLLVFALIVNPAAASYQITYDLKKMFLLSSIFGMASGCFGLLIAFWLDIPAGAPIALFSVLIFIAATIFSPKRKYYAG
ncbi:MAG: metal ABC transporter permease [Candidatus Omnitrophica bacterium]|nr:metal ABC transporter permease [Candidatus Omnitrophota bacterium]